MLQLLFGFTKSVLYGTATRGQVHHGDSKDFSPSNDWNNSKTAVLRQRCRVRIQSSRGSCNAPSHTTRRASYGTTRFLPTGDTSGISPISANHLLLMASAACGDTDIRYHPLRLMASSHALHSGNPDFISSCIAGLPASRPCIRFLCVSSELRLRLPSMASRSLP